MITKERFVKLLKFIKTQNKKQEKFVHVLEELSPNCYCDCYLYTDYEAELTHLLSEILNDTDDEIGHFLYDLDWLNNSKIEKDRCPQDADGNILYSSVETLYDYLVNKKESK